MSYLVLQIVVCVVFFVIGWSVGRVGAGGEGGKLQAERDEARREATKSRAMLDGANSKATAAVGELAEVRKALVAMTAERDAAIEDDQAPFEALRLKHDVLLQRVNEAEQALNDCKKRCNELRAERAAAAEAQAEGAQAEGAPDPTLQAELEAARLRIVALEAAAAAATAPASEAVAVAAAGLIAVAQPDEPRASDDLKKLEGIGPAIQRLLAENGVHSFAQLAAADVEDLRAYVLQGGRHMKSHDPSSWPQQAALAAEGRWDELHALREALRTRR